MGKDIAIEINEKWPELGQQIIKLAKKELDNHLIQDFLKDLPEELPEGGFWHVDAPKICICTEYIVRTILAGIKFGKLASIMS